MASNNILLIEDEPDIREMLEFSLSRAGYAVSSAATAEEALSLMFETELPALAIIDWMLPGMQGTELAKRLREDPLTKEIPLIMLTARGEEEDTLRGFESGFDDYITKPFSPKELVARIKALLRRSGLSTEGLLKAGPLTLDLHRHEVKVDGTVISLGPTEFRLLEFFLAHPGRAFDRGQLLDRVWGRSAYVEERTVDVHVLRLRKALKPHDVDGMVQTVRGVGYRFQPPTSNS